MKFKSFLIFNQTLKFFTRKYFLTKPFISNRVTNYRKGKILVVLQTKLWKTFSRVSSYPRGACGGYIKLQKKQRRVISLNFLTRSRLGAVDLRLCEFACHQLLEDLPRIGHFPRERSKKLFLLSFCAFTVLDCEILNSHACFLIHSSCIVYERAIEGSFRLCQPSSGAGSGGLT